MKGFEKGLLRGPLSPLLLQPGSSVAVSLPALICFFLKKPVRWGE